MSTDRSEKSFSFKVFRSFAASILIVSAVFTVLLVSYQRKALEKDLQKEGRMLADILAYNSRTWVFAENKEMLKDVVQGVMGQKNVVAVAIYNADKKLLLVERKDGRPAGAALKPVSALSGLTYGGSNLPEVIESGDTVEFLSPVILETFANAEETLYLDNVKPQSVKSVTGYVRVILGKDVLRQEMKNIFYKNALIAIVFLLTGSIVIYIAVKRVMRPLTSLAESVRSLGKGETVEKVPVESEDEIGRLAMDFNTMSENLKKREEEKQALEEQLRHAQKMEAIGTLARGIAHDFNNILATLRGSIYLMEKKLADHEAVRQYTGQVHNSISKAQNLIRGLLTFGRTQTINASPVDLNKLVRKMQPTLSSIAGEGVKVRVEFGKEPVMVMTDGIQMEQVLMNLCANARDAMPDGGGLSVSVQQIISDSAGAFSPHSPGPGKYALISVADTGQGIDEKTRERIFEPYYTTKDIGKGTGLGLSIVYGIIKQHKGLIDLETKTGEGTVFRIYLPLLEKNDADMENSTTKDTSDEV